MTSAIHNFILLSRRVDLYATKRFVQAAEKFTNVKLTVVDPALVVSFLNVAGHSPFGVACNNCNIDLKHAAVVPRISSVCPEYSIFALSQLEACGAFSLAKSSSIWISRNKFLTLQFLLQHHSDTIPASCIPPTVLLRSQAEVEEAVNKLGGYPVVLKYLRGTAGAGIILAHDYTTIKANLVALNQLNYDLILQKFYPEAREHDVRLIVLGQTVVAAVKRFATQNDFRSNYHQGSKQILYTPTVEEETLALNLARIFNFEFCAIDMIKSNEGLKFLEINSSPGFEGLEAISKIELPEKIIEYILTKQEAR